jgi:hypothetical protein
MLSDRFNYSGAGQGGGRARANGVAVTKKLLNWEDYSKIGFIWVLRRKF